MKETMWAWFVVVVGIVTYILGAITKIFIDTIPNKFIPIQNVLIGTISGLICYFTVIEPNLLQALVLCLIASMGAGGTADLIQIKKEEK